MKTQWAVSCENYSFSDTPRIISLWLPMIRTRKTPRNRSVTGYGYGARIPTGLAVILDGRKHRVYRRIFSNVGTCFIEKGGFRFYVNDSTITDEPMPEPPIMADVLSIDAWRVDGQWTWNNWYKCGAVPLSLALNGSTRKLLNALRAAGFLGLRSAGRVAIEDDRYSRVIVDRVTREPLLAVAYGAHV